MRDSISEAALYDCLVVRVDECVATIFDSKVCQKRYVIDGTPCRSLGSVLVHASSMQVIGAPDKWRLLFKDEAGQNYDFPVTDLNVIRDPSAMVARLAAAKVGKQRLILRIGLARGFDGFGKFAQKRCYVQVNGIVFPG